jgi:sugar lactone lactonase YvrE
MKTVTLAALVAAALVAGHLRLTAVEGARLRHLTSVYADDKDAGLKFPEGVACDATGRFVVADTGHDRLVRFTYQGKTISGGTEIKTPQLSAPSRVQLDSKGEIFALDSRQRRIVHLGSDGGFKSALAFAGVPAPATIVPKSFALDSADNVYVLDAFSARVLVLNAQGAFQRALPVPDGVGFASDLAVDAAGSLFLLDSVKRRMYSAGKDAGAFAPLGGDLTSSLATMPSAMTASRGVIFVAEGIGSCITAFGRDGSFLARQLTRGWEEGSLNHPSQICINDRDEVFIADRDNSRIQVFQLIR